MIKIEVTGTTLGEVSDKLLAIGASLQRTVSYEADDAARERIQAERNAAVAEEPTAEKPKRAPRKKAGNGALDAVGTGETTENEDAAPTPEETPTGATPALPAEEEPELPMGDAPKELSLDHDVAPRILEFVKANGREAMTAILDQFGVERASQLPPNRWPELLEKLGDA